MELLVLAVGLALDATAVTAGLAAGRRPVSLLFGVCILFGVFQAGMAGLGMVGGHGLAAWAHPWDHWVAAVLLVALGVRMVVSAEGDAEPDAVEVDLGVAGLIGLALATSLDALAAGVGVPHIGVGSVAAIAVIGLVTTVLCGAGALIGTRLAARLGPWADRIAGVVLVALGLRIVGGHLLGG
jgi:putative Mn2+ efflux pump MntP